VGPQKTTKNQRLVQEALDHEDLAAARIFTHTSERGTIRLLKNGFYIILNEVNDL
jgi:site-specific recombinase XerD